MDNQHRKIKGYRELSAEEIALMNEVKETRVLIGRLCEKLNSQPTYVPLGVKDGRIDKRWVAEGKTDLQKGLMSLTRSIAKPDFF